MTFKHNEVENFLKLFDASKNKIRNFNGCTHLELLKDYDASNVFSTYSIWKDAASLDAYRQSELFGEVWRATKAKFEEKPIAFSSKKFINVVGENHSA